MAKRARKTPSDTAVYDFVWAMLADPKLKAPAKCVGVALALKFRNLRTGQCNPSFATLGKIVGRDRRSVIDAVNELKAMGWVRWEGTAGGSKANTNKFSFPRLTGVELITPTGDELNTGDEKRSRGDELGTAGVMNSSHELSIEPSKNLSAGAPSFEGLGALGTVVSKRIGTAAFASWFGSAEIASDTSSTLTIAMPSRFRADEVRQRYGDLLLQSAQAIDPGKIRINVVAVEQQGEG